MNRFYNTCKYMSWNIMDILIIIMILFYNLNQFLLLYMWSVKGIKF